jgi:G3E family GTPase
MSDPSPVSAIPVNVITGALGVGKTSAIAKLLANKPPDEYWVVILNEFTDAGIDALTLASAARGAYDVRVIPGGCLCCTGELDFRRTLRAIIAERRPHRILIEPSGIGHPGGVLEELRAQERGGSLRLMSTIGLVDPQRLSIFESEGVERDQLEVADVLLLAKADTATEVDRQCFLQIAKQCFPPKRLIGTVAQSLLTAEVLSPPVATYSFALPERPQDHGHANAHSIDVHERRIVIGTTTSIAHVHTLLGRHACGWALPRELVFNRVQLHDSLLRGAGGLLTGVDRLKAVLRTGIEHWTLFNVSALNVPGYGVTATPCGWRQDSRIEVQMQNKVEVDWLRWDGYWHSMLS